MTRKRIRQGQTWYSSESLMTRRYVRGYQRHEPKGTNFEGITVRYTDVSLCHDNDVYPQSMADLFVERDHRMCAPVYFLNNSTTRKQSRKNALLRQLSTYEFCRAMQPGVRIERPTFSQPERWV